MFQYICPSHHCTKSGELLQSTGLCSGEPLRKHSLDLWSLCKHPKSRYIHSIGGIGSAPHGIPSHACWEMMLHLYVRYIFFTMCNASGFDLTSVITDSGAKVKFRPTFSILDVVIFIEIVLCVTSCTSGEGGGGGVMCYTDSCH